MERDRQTTLALEAAGWVVLRFWETDVLRETQKIADRVEEIFANRKVADRGSRRAARSASIQSGGRMR